MRFFAVRSRRDVEKFASPAGWAPFEHSTVFTFKNDSEALIEAFHRELDRELLEMVEIRFSPIPLSLSLN